MERKIPEFGKFAEPSLLILTSLAGGPKHGYAIMQDVEHGTGRPMGAGTLYAALVRLEEQGLIEPLIPVDRRRPYRLTAVGASMLAEPTPRPVGVRPAGPSTARRDLAMTKFLIRLYPARWRARYGDEFGRSSRNARSDRSMWPTSSSAPSTPNSGCVVMAPLSHTEEDSPCRFASAASRPSSAPHSGR